MATVVLMVAGSLIGGPIGGAVGGLAGNAIDHAILRPKGREGPRLTELRVQTSSYGTQIPRIFGTMRVAGSVIWATDLIEHRTSRGGGKGKPSTTEYSYTASFAVALSARPILGVGRIWADGKLLRGAAGDFKARTGFRLHVGSEDQAPDPLIASIEGTIATPAHRGIAYAVFEDLALGDFGNRIPSLTFEVIGDAGPQTADAIAREIAGDLLDTPEAMVPLMGFAASGASVRAVLETLAGAAGGWFRAEVGKLTLLGARDGAARALDDAGAGAERGVRRRRDIAAADSAPQTVTLAYYEPARDYQAGIQRATRPGAGQRESRVELAAAIDAASAKALAETILQRLDIERERRTLALPWRLLSIRPGERVTIAGAAGIWRVDQWRLEGMVLLLECVAVAPGMLITGASGGRVLSTPDLPAGETALHIFELPPLGAPVSVPRLAIAAAGTGPGWRSAALLLSEDDGASWSPIGGTAPPAILGTVVTPPGAAPSHLEDRRNHLVVELANGAMVLHDADPAAMAAGANLAMVGDELLQFARATPLGERRWTLDGLWRGRRGTEAAIATQATGDRFVLLDAGALVTRDLPATVVGRSVRVFAQGLGEAQMAETEVSGLSVVPPSPVHLRSAERADGGADVDWVRRSRGGWDWIDGVDVPLSEEFERYQVTLVLAEGAARIVETDTARISLTAEERPAVTTIRVRQIGAQGLSAPASLSLSTSGED
ncbi:hypothetical protein FHS95_003333 [Sphingomonas naasensis]|uniref:Uncharacterized protein n=1 Tax=Sphingomonas naasensis TaxID=1344951 RepID=A0A4S1WEH6_9SPHN|nr:phage tail protein [Sphingomonas naasensis]NIJ21630.1 hypothetical protein [Sphingomonas naasensis]TGX41434.1 hypothetical protein E5A74_12440 [Sphingomonas naasensis]